MISLSGIFGLNRVKGKAVLGCVLYGGFPLTSDRNKAVCSSDPPSVLFRSCEVRKSHGKKIFSFQFPAHNMATQSPRNIGNAWPRKHQTDRCWCASLRLHWKKKDPYTRMIYITICGKVKCNVFWDVTACPLINTVVIGSWKIRSVVMFSGKRTQDVSNVLCTWTSYR